MRRVYHGESRPRPAAAKGGVRAVRRVAVCLRLHAHDLDVDAPGPRAVQFGEQNRLEPSERQLTAADTHRDTSAQEGGAQVGVRVAPLAVGEAGIVVTVAVTTIPASPTASG